MLKNAKARYKTLTNAKKRSKKDKRRIKIPGSKPCLWGKDNPSNGNAVDVEN